jgi:hypothetical protein
MGVGIIAGPEDAILDNDSLLMLEVTFLEGREKTPWFDWLQLLGCESVGARISSFAGPSDGFASFLNRVELLVSSCMVSTVRDFLGIITACPALLLLCSFWSDDTSGTIDLESTLKLIP